MSAFPPKADMRPPLLPPPALGERRHRGLARLGVAVCRPAVAVIAEGERPEPRRSYRRSDGFHDAADHDAIRKHVVIVVFPLAGGTGSRCALEGEIVLLHWGPRFLHSWHSATEGFSSQNCSNLSSRSSRR